MQGGQEVGRGSVSDLAEELGEGFLHQTARGQSGDGLERRRIRYDGPVILPDANANSSRLDEGLPTSHPHPGELSGGWGEFEGFRESSDKFSQSFELLGRAPECQPLRTPSLPKEGGSCQVQQGGPWVTGTAAGPSSEVFLWLSGKYFVSPLDFAQASVHWGCGVWLALSSHLVCLLLRG